jgi:metal-sulfur cluster biosynthetic enzyme
MQRLLDRAIVQAEGSGLDPGLLVVAAGSAHAADDVIQVRRKAYGIADWIHSPTCRVQIVLRPAGLSAAASTALIPPPEGRVLATPPADVPADSADERVTAVRKGLSNVIDPDLGVNIVDLGFVRAVTVDGATAVITMTLTSAACPLTGVIENQIRTQLAALGCIEDFRIEWQEATATTWSPRMPQLSSTGRRSWCSSVPTTRVRTSGPAAARPPMMAVHCRNGSRPAFARTWKTVMKSMIVATSMR